MTLSKRLAEAGVTKTRDLNVVCSVLVNLYKKLVGSKQTKPHNAVPQGSLTLSHFLKVCDYLISSCHVDKDNFRKHLVVGIRLLLLDSLQQNSKDSHVKLLLDNIQNELSATLEIPLLTVQNIFGDPSFSCLKSPLTSKKGIDNVEYIKCEYTGVLAQSKLAYSNQPNENRLQLISNFGLKSTKTTIQNVARIFAALSAHSPLLMEGPPGVGKTAVVEAVGRLLGRKVERINFSANTSIEQLLGSIIPRIQGDARVFEWQDGALVKAIKEKKWILFDEINLAPPETLEALTPLLRRGATNFDIPGTDESVSINEVQIFATMNPVSIGGGRNRLPRSVQSMFSVVKLGNYGEYIIKDENGKSHAINELKQIVYSKFDDILQDSTKWGVLTSEQLENIFQVHEKVRDLVDLKKIGKGLSGCNFNLRDLIKLHDVLKGNAENIEDHFSQEDDSNKQVESGDVRTILLRRFLKIIYARGLHDIKEQSIVEECINEEFPCDQTLDHLMEREVDQSVEGMIKIGTIYLSQGKQNNTSKVTLIHTQQTLELLESIASVAAQESTDAEKTDQNNRAVLLEGATCSGKTALVKELARLAKNKLVVVSMTNDTEASDLIGQWLPTNIDDSGRWTLVEPAVNFLDKNIRDLIVFTYPSVSYSCFISLFFFMYLLHILKVTLKMILFF